MRAECGKIDSIHSGMSTDIQAALTNNPLTLALSQGEKGFGKWFHRIISERDESVVWTKHARAGCASSILKKGGYRTQYKSDAFHSMVEQSIASAGG